MKMIFILTSIWIILKSKLKGKYHKMIRHVFCLSVDSQSLVNLV